ncbi:hypothetical protein [Planococcus sp. YIM B11945]|uniref:hypothetical protein n=1 Tax=Planococcus sp. YIM B11945 TaxID=3435410 RepID=UPI003D7E0B32
MSINSNRNEARYRKAEIQYSKIALFISIISLLSSFITIGYTIYTDNERARENIYFAVNSNLQEGNFDTTLIPARLPDFEYDGDILGVVPVNYEIILANNGENTVSIISYDLWQIDNQVPIQFSHLKNGIYEKNDLLEFPLTIESGKSRKITIKVGIQVKDFVFKILEEEFGEGKPINFNTLETTLLSQNTDLFGNKVVKNNNNIYSTDLTNEKIYKLSFTTSKGKTFEKYFNTHTIEY